MKTIHFIFAAIFVLIEGFGQLAAQIPRTLSYQGVLTDNAGKPRPDGSYSFTFRLYTSPTGGTAIWSESKSLSVKSGLFSTELGKETPFGAAVKFETQYWLGIQVGNDPELSPRIALTSVGYSFSALRADTARVSVASLADTTWKHSGANIHRMNGNVGIGTDDPLTRVHITYPGDFSGGLRLQGDANDLGLEMGTSNDGGWLQGKAASFEGNSSLLLNPAGGDVGIGTAPSGSRFQVYKNFSGIENQHTVKFSMNDAGIDDEVIFLSKGSLGGQSGISLINATANGASAFYVRADGQIGIGTDSPEETLDVNGTTRTKVLEITGGSDLAEPFEISENQPIPKGALVIIDEENPGRLKLSHQTYDKRVAGVVSGAGGINPGLTLTQEGVLEGGQNVALSGRVYALATAANGPIKPGDLLTTSDVPGHAMRATDAARSHGTIIGKAMSLLEDGEGLVLVLVNLQ